MDLYKTDGAGIVTVVCRNQPDDISDADATAKMGGAYFSAPAGTVTIGMLRQGDGMLTDAPEPPPTAAELMAYAVQKRWEVETGGIVFGGTAVSTDPTSQSKIANAQAAFAAGVLTGTIQFKSASGSWLPVDSATLTAIYGAVVDHVQDCYATESAVDAAITAGTVTTYADIDAWAWPSNS